MNNTQQIVEEYGEYVIVHPVQDAYQGNPAVMPRCMRNASKLLVQLCDTAPNQMLLLANAIKIILRAARVRGYIVEVYRPGWRSIPRRHECGKICVTSRDTSSTWDVLYFNFPAWEVQT